MSVHMKIQRKTRAKGRPRIKPARLRTPAGLLDEDGAVAYAVERLANELPVILTYHTLTHTQLDVVPALERLASLEGIDPESLTLVRTAAFYHDLGFVIQTTDHEEISKAIAAEVLPNFGYTTRQIDTIQSMISATRLPQAPLTLLEQILADADLDVLGRPDFLARNRALRAEREALGARVSDVEWYGSQLDFLKSHRYFTASAHSLRSASKAANITALEQLLRQAQSA